MRLPMLWVHQSGHHHLVVGRSIGSNIQVARGQANVSCITVENKQLWEHIFVSNVLNSILYYQLVILATTVLTGIMVATGQVQRKMLWLFGRVLYKTKMREIIGGIL